MATYCCSMSSFWWSCFGGFFIARTLRFVDDVDDQLCDLSVAATVRPEAQTRAYGVEHPVGTFLPCLVQRRRDDALVAPPPAVSARLARPVLGVDAAVFRFRDVVEPEQLGRADFVRSQR